MHTQPITAIQHQLKKRKMKPGGGKSKGSGFESTVAKLLTKQLHPLNFIRTPGSGARVGGKNFATIGAMFGEDALKIFVGDVVPVNERQEGVKFLHSVECKFYATCDNFTSLASGKANVFKWFNEAVADAAKIDKNPMLIFKWNHTPIFVATNVWNDDNLGTIARKIDPCFTILTYGENKQSLDIYELDKLLTVPEFWFSKT